MTVDFADLRPLLANVRRVEHPARGRRGVEDAVALDQHSPPSSPGRSSGSR